MRNRKRFELAGGFETAADAPRERQRRLKKEPGGYICTSCENLKERLHILEGWIRWERGEGPEGYLEKYKLT